MILAQTKEHERGNGKSAHAATSPHGHCANVADSNRADLNCDGSLEGDPLIVARTVLKLSNGVAAARPPF